MKKTKLLYCIIPTLMLLGCSNQERNGYDSVHWCVEKLKEKTKQDSLVYTYEKLQTENYDYSYERTKDKESSQIEGFIFNLYLNRDNKYICIIEYNIKAKKTIKKEDIYNIYCSGIY